MSRPLLDRRDIDLFAFHLADRDMIDAVVGKLRACRFSYECELPKVDALLALVASRSDATSGASSDIF